MVDQEQAKRWIERWVDGGEKIPPDMDPYIQQITHTLNRWTLPTPPPSLVDDVMDFIQEREHANVLPKEPSEPSVWLSLWRSWTRMFPEFQIPTVLQHEAWPTVLASMVIFFGVFVVPQVEAGKDSPLLNSPLAQQVTRVANQIHESSEALSNQLRLYTSEVIEKVTRELQISPKPMIPSTNKNKKE